MSARDDYVTAYNAGKTAAVTDDNPYYGQGVLADLWWRGYLAMIEQRRADSPSRLAALRAQNPRPQS